jgi:hypothetical protein
LVRFGLNLGLNNLKFDQEAIFAVYLIQLSRYDRSNKSDRVDFDQKWLPGRSLSC